MQKKNPPSPSRAQAIDMFDKIANRYDRANKVLSGGFDRYFRRCLIKQIPKDENLFLLDVATGTCDQLISLLQARENIQDSIGIDLAKKMLAVGQTKLERLNLGARAKLQIADALCLPFLDNTFDLITLSFGIRNFLSPERGLQELLRVLKPNKQALILEFSLPKSKWLSYPYLFYLRHLLPKIGGWIAKDQNAYRYLNQTIETFPHGENFLSLMQNAGFYKTRQIPLFFGIASLYIGYKP